MAEQVRRNLLGITDKQSLTQAEANYASIRIAQLKECPIKGEFDVTHLRAINHYIFQDVYPDAGELRNIQGLWRKNRVLKNMQYLVYYKPANEMQAELPKVLERAKQGNWAHYNTAQTLAVPLAKLYGDLDYQHPFRDGNSRTLRAFTEQWVAEKTHLHMDWTHTRAPIAEHEKLYIARDAEVLRRAMDDQLIAYADDRRTAMHLIQETQKRAETLTVIIGRSIFVSQAKALVDSQVRSIQQSDAIVNRLEKKYQAEQAKGKPPPDVKKPGPQR